jgi:hypothetical protein
MSIANNHTFERLIRAMDEAQRDYYNGNATLDRTKKQLAEFVLANIDNIDAIDLSAFHESCDNARSKIQFATDMFNEAKAKMIAHIENQTLNYF